MVRGPKEQSLLERSRKVLGESSRKIFQIGSRNGKDAAEDGPEDEASAFGRRRNQVRRAQRSHRERKENYIKALEDEVVRLRSTITTKIRELETRADELVQFIVSSGLQVPPHLQKPASHAAQSASVTLQPEAWLKFSMNAPVIRSQNGLLDLSDRSQNQPSASISPDANETSPMHSGTSTDWTSPGDVTGSGSEAAIGNVVSHRTAPHNGVANPHQFNVFNNPTAFVPTLGDAPSSTLLSPSLTQPQPDPAEGNTQVLGDYTIAMNFVLTLEHMCTQAHLDPFDTGAGSGHVLMGSAHLLNQGPRNLEQDITWEVPNSSIEQLLFLSSQLNLEGEITPVQAWQKLQQHPLSSTLDLNKLNEFTQRMCQYVKCYGFGAVLHTEVFEEELAKLFHQI